MALFTLTVFFILLLLTSISLLILFLKRRRGRRIPVTIVTAKSNLIAEDHELQQQQEELEDSPATCLLPPPPPPPQPPEEKEEDPPVGGGGGGGAREEKRRKKKGKKKRSEAVEGAVGPETDRAAAAVAGKGRGGAADCPFPFSSFASATQRKIKVQYDELVKSNRAKKLTMTQVGQFVNCLVEARNELQHKSEIIQRSFKIKKALLVKADRSSFDRLCQQIYKLEAEQKRLEEDAAVYNLLQEQLKLSPAYKTMLEVGASMELKNSQDKGLEMDFCDISFEELLAQEKKDSFWQRNGKLRSFTS